MITLFDIMQLDCMGHYQIIAGPTDFHQPVVNVAVLDHEPISKRYDDFFKNEFVLTSLLFGINNPALIKEAIFALVDRKISVIAIKKVYDFEFDQEMIDRINQSQTTILLYQDVNLEDIISSVKHLLYKDNDESKYEHFIQQLIKCESTNENVQNIIHELIPTTWEKIRCHLIESNKNDSFITALYQIRKSLQDKQVRIYKYQSYYLMIEEAKEEIQIQQAYLHHAISDVLNHDELCYALQQVTQTMDYAKKHQLEKANYSNMQSDIFVYAVKENWLIQSYCTKQMEMIHSHDETYGTNLMETLLCYIKCHGDVKQCGNLLYQHPNTIRYRIGKIKDLFHLNDLEEKCVYEYLFMLVNFKNNL